VCRNKLPIARVRSRRSGEKEKSILWDYIYIYIFFFFVITLSFFLIFLSLRHDRQDQYREQLLGERVKGPRNIDHPRSLKASVDYRSTGAKRF